MRGDVCCALAPCSRGGVLARGPSSPSRPRPVPCKGQHFSIKEELESQPMGTLQLAAKSRLLIFYSTVKHTLITIQHTEQALRRYLGQETSS